MDIISKRIKELREEHGLTQEQLAKELNISRNAISNYENGVRMPDINLVIKLCDVFNVTLDSFIKDEIVYKKPQKSKLIKFIFQIIVFVLLIVMIVLSIILFDKVNKDTRVVDDKTKVANSNEIAIINITNQIDSKTYEISIIDKLKGDDFSFIKIKSKDVEVNISSNYLVFGNRISKDSQYKNYVSFDIIEINSPQYIQELSGDDITNHPTVDYYKELINLEPKKDVLVANLINPRKEEYTINSRNIYDNPYDSFDLNEDFDIKFKDAYDYNYKYVDVIVSSNVDIDNKLIIHLFSNNNEINNLEEYVIKVNNPYKFSNYLSFHFINIDISVFDNNDKMIFVKYSYSSLLNSSWSNSNLNVKLIYRM